MDVAPTTVASKGERLPEGPRAILRVPDILLAVAEAPEGASFAELRARLGLPKSSLHRLLHTLEDGGYLDHRSGAYFLGAASVRLTRALTAALPASEFPGSTRPTLEWLARETGESVVLAVLKENAREVSYVDVINSTAPLRFTVPARHTRPLYAAASGQVILAYLPAAQQQRYFAEANFEQLTDHTLTPERLAEQLADIAAHGVVFDRNGSFIGASAVASPCFNPAGEVQCAVSIAGPTERLEARLELLQATVRIAGERISRILGYGGLYPPLR